jgi:hypothetical protein
MPADTTIRPRPNRRRLLVLGAFGLFCGLLAGLLIGRLIKAAKHSHALGWSDELSLAIAALLSISGLGVLAATLANASAVYLADPHAAEPGLRVRPAQIAYFRLQGAVLALAGLLMVTPELLRLLKPDLDRAAAMTAYVGLFVAFGLQTALNILIWRRSDELIRRAMSEGAAACFWLLQGLLFLWAAGEKLRLLPRLDSWDALTVLMAVYLIMSTIVGYRRGLG